MTASFESKLYFLFCLFCLLLSQVYCEIECFANIDSVSGSNCDSKLLLEDKIATSSECCLGNGFWFRNVNESDECMQCIGELN